MGQWPAVVVVRVIPTIVGRDDHPSRMTTSHAVGRMIRAVRVRSRGMDRMSRSEPASVGVNRPAAVTSERVALGADTFEIVVKGRLSPTLVAAIEGFEVTHCDQGQTHLVGWVPDQARLHSLLELLRDLNIELTSVNPVRSGKPDRSDGGSGPFGTRGPVDG